MKLLVHNVMYPVEIVFRWNFCFAYDLNVCDSKKLTATVSRY